MNGFKDTNQKRDEYRESMRLFISAKNKTLHSMAGFGNKHKLLRWPVFVVLAAFLFLYNLFYYIGLHFHLKDKVARGLAFVMSFLMIFSVLDVSTLMALAALPNENGAKVVSIENPENISVLFGTKEDDIEFPSLLNVVIEREREAESTNDAIATAGEAEVTNDVIVTDVEAESTSDAIATASEAEVTNDVIVTDGEVETTSDVIVNDVEVEATDETVETMNLNAETVETIEENMEVLYTGADMSLGEIISETIENPVASENPGETPMEETTDENALFVTSPEEVIDETALPVESTEQISDENNDEINHDENMIPEGEILPEEVSVTEEVSENVNETEITEDINKIEEIQETDEVTKDIADIGTNIIAEIESEIIGSETDGNVITGNLPALEDVETENVAETSPETVTVIETYYENVEVEVKWECKKYDPNTPGEYIFEAKLPAKFNGEKLDYSNVEIPAITVTVLTEKIELTADAGDVTVKLSADRGVFPDNVTLSANIVEDAATINEVEGAIEGLRDEETNVTSSMVFDIKVLDEEGNEVEPDTTKGGVYVTFENKKIADANLDTDVYHVHDGEAEELAVEENGETALVETDSFSFYVVEFTYNNLEYVLQGDTRTELKTILDFVGLSGDVTSAVSSNESLFTAYVEDNVWYVNFKGY